MSEIQTTFNTLHKNPRRIGFPPRPDNIETVEEYPTSEKIEADCPSCEYRGTLAIYDGHNCYHECPKCETAVMVNGRDG